MYNSQMMFVLICEFYTCKNCEIHRDGAN